MSFNKKGFGLLIIILFAFFSCEDSKSGKNNSENNSASEKKSTSVQRDLAKEVKIPGNGSTSSEVNLEEIEKTNQEELIPFLEAYGKENPETKVLISTEMGNITVELYKETPLHRANFIRLVKLGYFNTTCFHRVAENFVIQGGNSDKIITSKVRNKVGAFLLPNEYKSAYPHNRGAFSAAKYSEQNVSNASSPFEFFIVQPKKGAHHLDNDHTVFGKVIKGMAVVDKISKVATDNSEWPIENIWIKAEVIN